MSPRSTSKVGRQEAPSRAPCGQIRVPSALWVYHRHLRRLVAIDLKLEEFKPGDKGQMELYLRWLEKYEKQVGEEPPIGLILCANKSDEHVELLQLSKSGIRVAAYLTELPPRKLLQQKLHSAMTLARKRLEENAETPQ